MTRIPEAELERIKREVPLVELVAAKGIELKRHGADLLGLCPFHNDTSPSLVVSPAKNLWNCLGACQSGGSVVDWVMKAEGVSFREAVERLRAKAPAALVPSAGAAKERLTAAAAPPAKRDANDHEALGQVADYYHAALLRSPEGLAYLEKRGLKCDELIKHFRIGFADRTLGQHLPKSKRAGVELRERLQTLGVLRSTGHEHLRGCLVVPISDATHTVQNLYGRRIGRVTDGEYGEHLYLPGPRRGVFNVGGIACVRSVILCEAILDAMTFWCAGFRNVTCAYGVNGFTEELAKTLSLNGTAQVYIAYDGDEAGNSAATSLATKLQGEGMACWRVVFPPGHDANSFALASTNASESLAALVDDAQWMGQGPAPMHRPRVPRQAVSASTPASSAEKPALPPPTAIATAPALMPAPAPVVQTASPSPAPVTSASRESPTIQPLMKAALQRPANAVSAITVPTRAPSSAAPDPVAEQLLDGEVQFRFGERRWRVRGLLKNASLESLKVNLQVALGDAFHIDTLDLYSAKHRAAFVTQAAEELALEESAVKRDMGRVLLRVEALHEQELLKTNEPTKKLPEMTPEEREAALSLLRDPHLIDRILEDFDICGVVGERDNKLVGYLATISRKLNKPLAIVIQSSSAAGKSALMEAILSFVPAEDKTKFSAMTGQSLFYMGEADLKHKVLAVAEETGAERASYALKLLQSEGELNIASTSKDPVTGRMVTHAYHVEGPVMIILTTTAVEVDEELLNRCVVLSVDEDEAQTAAIHALQREEETLEGMRRARRATELRRLHANAQRLLRPLRVLNPYANDLTFLKDRTRLRRDHKKYLMLIRTVALLHQYQREVELERDESGQPVECIKVTLDDIRVANELAERVLGRSLDDLPPQTRRLLQLLDKMVAESCATKSLTRRELWFLRKDVRAYTGWGDTQLKVHLGRLVELEYVAVHKSREGQSFAYELLYDGQGKDGTPYLPGLIDVEALGREYDARRSGQNATRSGCGRPPVGSGADRSKLNEHVQLPDKSAAGRANCERVTSGEKSEPAASYVTPAAAQQAAS